MAHKIEILIHIDITFNGYALPEKQAIIDKIKNFK